MDFFCCRRSEKKSKLATTTKHGTKASIATSTSVLSASDIAAGQTAAQVLLIDAGRALIADCCLIVEEDDAITVETLYNTNRPVSEIENVIIAREQATESLKKAGASTTEAAAKILRISLIPRGTAPIDRATRLRYVKATAEKVFERLDEIQPISQEIRENRRSAIVLLQACERRADIAFSKLQQKST